MSLFSRFGYSARRSARRRVCSAPSSAEVLEVRRLLTNAAPSLTDIVAVNGEISADVTDDGSGGAITITLSFDDSGDTETWTSYEGASHVWSVADKIPPNTSAVVTIVITESPLTGGGTALSRTYDVTAQGLQMAELDFAAIESAPGEVYGVIGTAVEGAVGTLMVMYRELGDIDWRPASSVDPGGSFSVGIGEADGTRDYEFVVANQYYGQVAFGEPVTMFDVPGIGSLSEGLLDEDEYEMFA
ncbi:MAG: hypothetical protein NXI04_24000 [Planctomycetaceae bacterium]|nr:hypothetical protein [Planctomycetaceae bacterium]